MFSAGLEAESLQQEENVEEVKTDYLVAGFILRSDIETTSGKLILAKGTELTKAQVERLRNIAKLHTLKEPVWVLKPKPA